MTEVFAAIVGALIGSVLSLLFALWQSQANNRAATTQQLISTFFSDAFLEHRSSVGVTWTKVRAAQTTPDEIAGGYWYPGNTGFFEGSTRGSLTEHEHLEAYLGFLVRVDHALTRRQVDTGDLRAALAGGMIWHKALVLDLANAVETQSASASVSVPPWVPAARRVMARLT